MPKNEFSYDPACGDLARHFLPNGTRERQMSLAQHIQQSVEDWFNTSEDGKEYFPVGYARERPNQPATKKSKDQP